MFQALPSVLATGWGRQALEGFREPATGVEKSRWEGSSTGGPCLSWERRHSPRQIDQASGGAGAVGAGRLGVSVAVGVPIVRTD